MSGAELVALIAVLGSTFSGILTTLFHSRCSHIRGCGIECDREIQKTKEEIELEKFELEHKEI